MPHLAGESKDIHRHGDGSAVKREESSELKRTKGAEQQGRSNPNVVGKQRYVMVVWLMQYVSVCVCVGHCAARVLLATVL